MAAGDVARVVRAPGSIVIGPTDLSTPGSDNSYGGTLIGKSKDAFFGSSGIPFPVPYEALGEAGDVLEADKSFAFVFFSRGWDDDAVEKMLAGGYAAGTVTQHAVWSEPGAVPGTSAIGRAVILLYVPDDLIHVNAVLIYRGIPDLPEGAEMALQRGTEFGIPLSVFCMRDGNANMFSVGRLDDLSLT